MRWVGLACCLGGYIGALFCLQYAHPWWGAFSMAFGNLLYSPSIPEVRCWLIGHSLPAIVHPWWGDRFHATCLRCKRECDGWYDPKYGDVDWRVVK